MSIVVVLGASSKNSRYSNKATRLLQEKGEKVIPVNPFEKEICGLTAYPDLKSIHGRQVDTLTVYLSPEKLHPLIEDIVRLNPGRIIMNPGTEDEEVIRELRNRGLEVMASCTLVMLKTGQF